jgi:hypothetical protein
MKELTKSAVCMQRQQLPAIVNDDRWQHTNSQHQNAQSECKTGSNNCNTISIVFALYEPIVLISSF